MSIYSFSSEKLPNPVRIGKRIAGAEFCAPMDSMYGHILYLADKVDYIFFPVYLEAGTKPDNTERYYCYYTQFSSSVIATIKDKKIREKCLFPFLNYKKDHYSIIKELYQCLEPVVKPGLTITEVANAYNEAIRLYHHQKKQLEELFNSEFKSGTPISVVLLGRPYIVLAPSMNKGIPDIFAGMGIKTFYQDMIPDNRDNTSPDDDHLLKTVPWYYAAKILETAKTIASIKNLYPVLITAFKCAPDSFVIEYIKKIFDCYQKPYLILQIDEHDSNMGYETRIEAAIRTFRNHASTTKYHPKVNDCQILPEVKSKIGSKTLLIPNWDPIVSPLLVANIRRSGVDARLLQSEDIIVRKSMSHNTGQCLPMNIITQEFIEYIEKHGLRPENTLLWMVETKLSCNIRMYVYYMKSLLDSYGHGMEKAGVYSGDFTFLDISLNTCFYGYFAYMLGGFLKSLGCRIRPYEKNPEITDETIQHSIKIFEQAFLGNDTLENAAKKVFSLFDRIEIREDTKPKVAIFGDFYIRDNDVVNQNLIHFIENAGGEVITTPYSDYVKITSDSSIRRMMSRGEILEAIGSKAILAGLKLKEKKCYEPFEKYLGKQSETDPKRFEKHLVKFNVTKEHSGESYDNILNIFYLLENHPDISLFVQTNPAFCCPSLITEAMADYIREITGIPMVTITYDGTSEFKNDLIIPYLTLVK